MARKKEPQIVEGTKEDTGFKGFVFTDEMCSFCSGETFNIPIYRVSLCAHCGAELFPCSACESKCDWDNETHSCHKYSHTEQWIESHPSEIRLGDMVTTFHNALIPNTVGKVVGLADDDHPGTTKDFIVDFGEDGTCTVRSDQMERYFL